MTLLHLTWFITSFNILLMSLWSQLLVWGMVSPSQPLLHPTPLPPIFFHIFFPATTGHFYIQTICLYSEHHSSIQQLQHGYKLLLLLKKWFGPLFFPLDTSKSMLAVLCRESSTPAECWRVFTLQEIRNLNTFVPWLHTKHFSYFSLCLCIDDVSYGSCTMEEEEGWSRSWRESCTSHLCLQETLYISVWKVCSLWRCCCPRT